MLIDGLTKKLCINKDVFYERSVFIMPLLFISLIILFIIGAPIAVALGFSSIFVMVGNDIPIIAFAEKAFGGVNSFPLLALPFFILAGNVMTAGGVSTRLVDFANVLIGWFRGGLGAVAVLSSMVFATMSGSSSATTAAIGTTIIPAMEKKGYPKNFAAATVANSGELGSIIPPSIPMIVYALIANVSVGSLFIAGILPGVFIGVTLMLAVIIISRLKNYDSISSIDRKTWFKNFYKTFFDAFLALLMPIIILGGIYSGVFTPTEAAATAVLYGLIISLFVFREIKFKDILPILIKSTSISAIILLIVSFASVFSYILTIKQVPQQIGIMVVEFTDNPLVFLLLANILMFIIGMFIETTAALLIIVPILAPIANQYGIDPIHFGIIMIVNISIGMITPPVAVNLYLAAEIANINVIQIFRPALVFLTILIIDLMIITYAPMLF